MDQEKQFLLSQQARLSNIERSQRIQHAEELHTFWKFLRSKLAEWQERLDSLTSQETDNNKQQDLVDLKEQLQLYQKHCLSSTPIIVFDDWQVPDNLPLADIRLLHKEFSNCMTKWEQAKEIVSPKGKFTFRRYRQEVARRKACGIPIFENSTQKTTPLKASAHQSTPVQQQQQQEYTKGACIQNLSNATIEIDADGNVLVNKHSFLEMPKVSAAALLVQKIEHCSIEIAKPLVTLHIVQTNSTQIIIKGDFMRAIHVTDCHNGTTIQGRAQQLRLHESTDLTCHVELAAGAILEDCTRLVFNTVDMNKMEVRDFNWLRTGIPSPNFEIVQIEAMEKTHHEEDTKEESTNIKDVVEVTPIEPAAAVAIQTTDHEEHTITQENVAIVEEDDDDDEL